MSVLLISYLAGFLGYETKAVVDYCDKEKQNRVTTKGEQLALDSAVSAVWPMHAGMAVKDLVDGE